jgi:hypothetical protein
VQAANYMLNNTEIDRKYFSDYGAGLTRLDGAYFLVPVYHAIMGKKLPAELAKASSPAAMASLIGANPFADTNDPFALMARDLGLMSGEGNNMFNPGDPLSRQHMTAMFMNLCEAAGINYNKADVSHIRFADQEAIAGWALGHVQRAYHLGLISGTSAASPPSFSPNNPITREQAFTMFWNMFMSKEKMEKGFTRGGVIGAPQLLYSGVGKAASDGDGYWAAPAIADFDRNGNIDIVYTAYSIYRVDAKTGTVKWEVPSGYDMRNKAGKKPVGVSFADVIIADIDGCGEPEIITGHRVFFDANGNELPLTQHRGFLAVYDKNGNFKWTKDLPRRLCSVAVADLDGNGRLSVVVGVDGESIGGRNLDVIHVFNHDGSVRPGWPQLNVGTDARSSSDRGTTGYIFGLQNNSIAVGDIDGSGFDSIIVPTDQCHIPAFDRAGRLLMANPVFAHSSGALRTWGRVGTWWDYTYEKKVENEGFGFGNQVWSSTGGPNGTGGMVRIPWEDVPLEERLYATFSNSRAIVADVDGSGIGRVVVVGLMQDAMYKFPDLPPFESLFILNGDRTRFKTDKYDWETVPKSAGPILAEDYMKIIGAQLMPTVADLNGNGVNDILYNSASGKVMCHSLDKQFQWSHWINDRDGHTIEFASPVVAYDLNKNGFKDIIFATNTPFASDKAGRLMILDYKGDRLQTVDLPPVTLGGAVTNGVVARPIVTEIDGVVYIILSTHRTGLAVYRMP